MSSSSPSKSSIYLITDNSKLPVEKPVSFNKTFRKTDHIVNGLMKEKEILQGFREVATASDQLNNYWGENMDETLKTLIDRIDQDVRDHKKEIRDRDLVFKQEISEREARFEKKMEQFAQDAKEREQRYLDDAREREQRFTTISTNIEAKISEATQHIEKMKSQNFWGMLAFFVGMVAIIITLVIALVK